MVDMFLMSGAVRSRLIERAHALAQACAPQAAQYDRSATFPFKHVALVRESGYLALTVPEYLGGGGASLLETVMCQEALAYGDGPLALVVDMPLHIIGGVAESHAWPVEALERVCRLIVDEGALINSAASEREMGSPSRGGIFATVARREGAGWLLNGRKIYTTGAPALTHALISASLDEGHGPTTTTGIFLIAMNAEGVRIEPTWQGSGMRAARNDDVILEDVSIDSAHLLLRRDPLVPDSSRGSTSAWFQLTIAGVYLGIAAAARDAVIGYARERRPTALGGKPISELPTIQRQLGQLENLLLNARALVYMTAQAWDTQASERDRLKAQVGLAKAHATANAVQAVDLAMLIAGGASMQPDLPLERLSRDVRAGWFHPPTLDAAETSLGQFLVGQQKTAPKP